MAKKVPAKIIFVLAIIASAYGLYGFFYHFFNDFGFERVILMPVILPLYQVPAIALFLLWKWFNKKEERV